MNHRIVNGDIMRFAAHYHGPKFHAVLCDPPYELGFMGKSWDSRGVSFRAETWSAISSLLLPGAHLLAFGGTRTFHRIAVAIEDASFEIRDTIGWMYGSGFPKSHDVSKAIDKAAGAERSDGARQWEGGARSGGISHGGIQIGNKKRAIFDTPATDDARAWQGYGTALKPAWEPVIVARKPLESTVARNCVEHGCGALNADGARVGDKKTITIRNGNSGINGRYGIDNRIFQRTNPVGRWPANIIHDGSEEVLELFPETAPAKRAMRGNVEIFKDNGGSAARFFYCAKTSVREREEGLAGFALRQHSHDGRETPTEGPHQRNEGLRRNHHPTVKPIALTTYLAKLIMPPPHIDARILVPFAGSGSECIGAALAGWRCVVGVEREAEYAAIARARLEHWTRQEAMA